MSYEFLSGSVNEESSFVAIADELLHTVQTAVPKLRTASNADASRPIAEGKWSRKQVIGHLIDSACNNHQRFVRAQETSPLVFPAYTQDHWVGCQRYQERSWDDLIHLWHAYNRHVAHVIAQIPEISGQVECRIGANAPVTLQFLARDYVGHLQHHLAQIGALA